MATAPPSTRHAPPPEPTPAPGVAASGPAGRPSWSLLRLAAAAVAVLCALPVLVVVVEAFGSGPAEALRLVWRPRVGELLGNTLALVVLTGAVTTVLGVGAAWLVERTALPWAGFWRIALVAPLAVPAFVNSFAWSALLPGLEGLGGAVLVTSLSYFPFVFLPVAAVLRSLDQGLAEAARALGLGPWRTFARVGLAQVRPAVLGGALLVAMHLLAEYGALEMLRFPTFTTAIIDQFEVAFDSRSGSVLAVVLIGIAVTLLTVEFLLRGQARHARVGTGTARRPTLARLGRAMPLAVLVLGGLVTLAVGVPGWLVVSWLLEADQVAPGNLLPTLTGTVSLALAAAAVTTVAALPAAWGLSRRRSWFAVLVERTSYVTASLPGVVVALALIAVTIRFARPVYQTSGVLVAAYVVLFIPRAMVAIRAAVAQVPPELTDAARALGNGPVAAFLRVQLPLTLRGTMAGFALVFIAVSTELTATLLLAPTGVQTLATAFWDASASLDYTAAAPFAAAMILLSAPLTYLLLHGRSEDSPT